MVRFSAACPPVKYLESTLFENIRLLFSVIVTNRCEDDVADRVAHLSHGPQPRGRPAALVATPMLSPAQPISGACARTLLVARVMPV